MLLEITVSLDGMAHIGELLLLLGTGFTAFYNLKSRVEVQKNEIKTLKEIITEMKISAVSLESKLETKIEHLESKIDKLPQDIANVFKTLISTKNGN